MVLLQWFSGLDIELYIVTYDHVFERTWMRGTRNLYMLFLQFPMKLLFIFVCLFVFIYFYCNIVDLQCYANLCCTAKWLSYTHVYILFHYGLSQEIGYSSLCYTVGLCCLSILNVIVCIYLPQTPSPSLSFPKSFFFFCHAAWLAGSYFPNQGLNQGPQQWKCQVLTTGPPRNSLNL